MKIITEYQCEICKKIYPIDKQAINCEESGVFNKEFINPGFVFSYRPVNSKSDFIFAVVQVHDDQNGNKHFGSISAAGYRNNVYGDNRIGEGTCGFYYIQSNIKHLEEMGFVMKDENFHQDEFARCLLDFEKHGIPITYLKDGKIHNYEK